MNGNNFVPFTVCRLLQMDTILVQSFTSLHFPDQNFFLPFFIHSNTSEWLMYEVDAVWGYDHTQTDVFAGACVCAWRCVYPYLCEMLNN